MTGGGALLEFAVRVGEPSHAATASDTATDLIYNQAKHTSIIVTHDTAVQGNLPRILPRIVATHSFRA